MIIGLYPSEIKERDVVNSNKTATIPLTLSFPFISSYCFCVVVYWQKKKERKKKRNGKRKEQKERWLLMMMVCKNKYTKEIRIISIVASDILLSTPLLSFATVLDFTKRKILGRKIIQKLMIFGVNLNEVWR